MDIDPRIFLVKKNTVKLAITRGYDVEEGAEDFDDDFYARGDHISLRASPNEIRLCKRGDDFYLLLPEEEPPRGCGSAISVGHYFHTYHHAKKNDPPQTTFKLTRGSMSAMYIRRKDDFNEIMLVYFSNTPKNTMGKEEYLNLIGFIERLHLPDNTRINRVLLVVPGGLSPTMNDTIASSLPMYYENPSVIMEFRVFEVFLYANLIVAPPEHSRAPKLKRILNKEEREKLETIGFTAGRLINRKYEDPFYRFHGAGIGDIVEIKTAVLINDSMIQDQLVYVRILPPEGKKK
jgi:DNA-directed RNA polymerase subunit H (RpoH/RPB5)